MVGSVLRSPENGDTRRICVESLLTTSPAPGKRQFYRARRRSSRDIIGGFTFELGKCEIRHPHRMLANFRNVDESLASAVADGLVCRRRLRLRPSLRVMTSGLAGAVDEAPGAGVFAGRKLGSSPTGPTRFDALTRKVGRRSGSSSQASKSFLGRRGGRPGRPRHRRCAVQSSSTLSRCCRVRPVLRTGPAARRWGLRQRCFAHHKFIGVGASADVPFSPPALS